MGVIRRLFINACEGQYQKYDTNGQSYALYKPVKHFKNCESGSVSVAELHVNAEKTKIVCLKEANLFYHEQGSECALELLGLRAKCSGLKEEELLEVATVVASVDPTMPYGIKDGRFYFGMHYEEGSVSLSDLIGEKENRELACKVKAEDIVKILYATMVKLNVMHRYNLIHGDLHINNIVVSFYKGQLKVVIIDPSCYMEKKPKSEKIFAQKNDIEFIKKAINDIQRRNKNLPFKEKDWELLGQFRGILSGYSNPKDEFPVDEELRNAKNFMKKKGIKFKEIDYLSKKSKSKRVFKYFMSNLTLKSKLRLAMRILKAKIF